MSVRGQRWWCGGYQDCPRQSPTITLRDLRHTAVPLAVGVGANLEAVPPMLVHKSAVLTSGTYVDQFLDDFEAVVDPLDMACGGGSVRDRTRTAADPYTPEATLRCGKGF